MTHKELTRDQYIEIGKKFVAFMRRKLANQSEADFAAKVLKLLSPDESRI